MTTNPVTGGMKAKKDEAYAYIPWQQMNPVARVYEMGAKKYSPWNWTKGYDWSLSGSSAVRHLTSFISGEDLDPESGEPHLAHVVFHCLTLIYFMEHHKNLDDRHLPSHTELKDGHKAYTRIISLGDILTFLPPYEHWNHKPQIVVNIDYSHDTVTIRDGAGGTGFFYLRSISTVNGVRYEYN